MRPAVSRVSDLGPFVLRVATDTDRKRGGFRAAGLSYSRLGHRPALPSVAARISLLPTARLRTVFRQNNMRPTLSALAIAQLATIIAISQLAGQSPEVPRSFDVATVKLSSPHSENAALFANEDASQVQYSNVPVVVLLMRAYDVHRRQILGPEWLGTKHFDVAAKLPDGANLKQIPKMLQALLAERFKLRAHNETRILPGFALLVGKGGPKMKIAEGERDLRRSAGGQGFRIKGKGTMAQPAEIITDCLDRPVIDLTALAGMFEVDLNWAREEGPEMPLRVTPGQREASVAPSGPSIFTVLQELGLKLEPRKTPADFLVIDHIEPIPTEN
jgi:uncharacterized protein (TIGR03435 family)